MYNIYLQQQDHVGLGQLLAVQSACSQTHDGHITDCRVSVCYTGQDLMEMEKSNDISQLFTDFTSVQVSTDVRQHEMT